MEPSIHVRALDLHCPRGMDSEGRRRLATVATRELPAALARTAGIVDDGRLIFVRRLDVRARLGGGSDQAAGARWAEAIAAALRDARDVVVFEQPLDALVAFVEAALGARPGEAIGRWPWIPTVLEAIRGALSALPALDGRSHAFTAAAPLPVAAGAAASPAPGSSIEWALTTAGALLPSLVARLAARDLAAAALGAIRPAVADAIVDRLVGAVAVPDTVAPVVSQASAAITAWPCPIASDPRNQLLVAALVLDERPSLRGTSALASVRSAATAAASADAIADAAREPGADADVAAPSRTVAAAATTAEPAAPVASAARVPSPSLSASPSPSLTASASAPDLATPAPDLTGPAPRSIGIETRFAGLLFLLEPLRRLELPAAILDEPALATEPGFPAVLYGTVCRLLPDAWADPSALALTDAGVPQAPPTAATPDRLAAIERAAARLAAAAARLPAIAHDADLGDAGRHAAVLPIVLPPWLDRFCCCAAAQLAAHLRARLDSDAPLSALAHKVAARSGTILVTRTHIDVILDLADVDLDVRRAALDVNPGWVPFLGRIVSFHYM